MRKCIWCGRWFKSRPAVIGHLAHCPARARGERWTDARPLAAAPGVEDGAAVAGGDWEAEVARAAQQADRVRRGGSTWWG